MDLERTVGTIAVRRKDYLDAPRATSPPRNKKPLKSRSNFSESSSGPSRKDESPTLPHQPFANLDRPATPHSDKSMAMFTAPDTPLFGRRNDFSNLSNMTLDGSPGSTAGVKDFAAVSEVTEGSDGDICPDCDLPAAGNDVEGSPGALNLPTTVATVPGSSASRAPIPGVSAPGTPPSSLPAARVSAPGVPLSTGPPAAIPAPGVSLTDGPSLAGIPAVPEVGGGKDLNIPSSNLAGGLAVPADITGKLDPPKTPPPSKKRMALGKGKKKGQKVIRRGRHLLLRKPVLSLVIGRQLAGPTSTALKLVSKGTAVDPTALTEAAVPGAVPQPVPLPT